MNFKKSSIMFIFLFFALVIFAQDRQTARINHIAHYVVNLKESTKFYHDIVGLDTIPEPFHDGRHTWFSIGDHSHLHLIQGKKERKLEDKNAHLCFTVNDVLVFTKLLSINNIPYENWLGEKYEITQRIDGVKQIYFNDPDGYWVEINDAKD